MALYKSIYFHRHDFYCFLLRLQRHTTGADCDLNLFIDRINAGQKVIGSLFELEPSEPDIVSD